jgi:hypothetical protein
VILGGGAVRSQTVRLPWEAQGINSSDFEMKIAVDALALKAIFVSRDKPFASFPNQRLKL